MAKKELTRAFFQKQGAKGGKLGGSKGGRKRAENLTAKARSEIAKKAAAARWGSKKKRAPGHEVE
jgi:hypothetical protein